MSVINSITRKLSPGTTEADAGALATRIITLETRIAQMMASVNELRNTTATVNPMTLVELTSRAPGFEWEAYLDIILETNPEGLKALKADTVNVRWPPFMKQIAEALEAGDLNGMQLVFLPSPDSFFDSLTHSL